MSFIYLCFSFNFFFDEGAKKAYPKNKGIYKISSHVTILTF